MFRYAMKAAAKSEAQLADRVRSFHLLKLKPVIELYLAGSDDIFGPHKEMLIKNCIRFAECEYIVHYPIMDPQTGYIYDACNDETKEMNILLDFSRAIRAEALIMHCCYGFDKDISKKEAKTGFFDKVACWNRLAKENNIQILIENYGFVWLPNVFNRDFVVSPVDHCFPWDLLEFYTRIADEGLHNIGIMLDTAHAVLSSNMFNMKKQYPHLKADVRFANIYDEDLAKTDYLKADDFVFDFIDYFHISDAFVWKSEDGVNDIRKYLYVENLPIGLGNIDYQEIFKNVVGSKVMVMEIDPKNGNHACNASQRKGIKWFTRSLYRGN